MDEEVPHARIREKGNRMFSESYSSEIRQYFDRQMILLENRREELKRKAKDQGNDLGRFSHVLLEQKLEALGWARSQ